MFSCSYFSLPILIRIKALILLFYFDIMLSYSNYCLCAKVLSYDGLHPPDSLAITAAGIAVYV